MDPSDTSALNGKGNTLGNLGKDDETITHYNKALDIDPNNQNALSGKNSILDQGRYLSLN